jgi:hypothetical protein
MSHNINRYDLQEGIEQAWHGLTTVRDRIELDTCWLSKWDVGRTPLFAYAPGSERSRTEFDLLVCDDIDHFIGKPIGKSYGVITNQSFLVLIRTSLTGMGHKIWSVGSVRNRGRVFVTIKLDQDHVRKCAKREFQDYITFGNSHDQSSELFTANISICTVCDNTYSMNLSIVRGQVENDDGEMEDDSVDCRLRHSKNAVSRLPAIADMIDKAIGVRAEFYKALESFAMVKCDESKAERLFTGFEASDDAKAVSTTTRNRVGELVSLFKRGKGNRGETLADVFQATTDYYTHSHTRKDLWKQFEASEYGSGASAKRQMFDTLRNGDRLERTVKRGETLLKASIESFV